MEAAVCCRLDACSSVRCDRSAVPLAISAEAVAIESEALGAQRGDAGCRIIGLRQTEGTLQWLAGGDEASLAPAGRARRCWPT